MGKILIDGDALHALIGQQLETHNGSTVDALASLCVALGFDPTLWPMTATTTGRVLTAMGRQARFKEEAQACGAIQINSSTETAFTAVPAVEICIEPQVPEDMEGALVAVGVELDTVACLYFDPAHGPTFRQRIKSKWRTFTDLCGRGLIQNPTGFFISAIKKNWMLSSSYVPGLKKPTPASRAEQERLSLQAQREVDAQHLQAQLDQEQQWRRQAQPEEQWQTSRGMLKLHLSKVLSSGEWQALERLCMAGRLQASEIAAAATRAKAALRWETFLSELQGQLRAA
ncbi:hypothetical protein [Deinococcus ruber]|uniref:Uncharacterized protein n=1 Tax=Deinococcus ruber TaxID=1848197 RepID=A0A918C8J3_9DEIO|nr:hypothetical protein [Deinococcus ruber]GGR11183.1 hypothetical protein GCM10008957_24820 [Deinococcus ruber]